MAPVEGTPGAFAVVVHLPPGYHQYKFIVDGKWMHDETAPYMPDPLGNVNNWLFVRKIELPPQQPHPSARWVWVVLLPCDCRCFDSPCLVSPCLVSSGSEPPASRLHHSHNMPP
jgi:hypothetical protein